MANSQLFGMPGQANHLFQAISVIGIMQLHDIMLSSLCIHTFSAMPEQALYQKTFWHYCIQCGIAA
jgi:HD-like signal output (HDOD) protein